MMLWIFFIGGLTFISALFQEHKMMIQIALTRSRRHALIVNLLFQNLSEFTEQRTLQIWTQTQWELCVEGTTLGAGITWLVSSDPHNVHGINHEILFSFETSCF